MAGGNGLFGLPVLENAVDYLPILFPVRGEVAVFHAESDEIGAGDIQLVVFIDEVLLLCVVNNSSIWFGLDLLGGSLRISLFYLTDVHDVSRQLETSNKDGEHNDKEYVPTVAKGVVGSFVIHPDKD